MRAIDYFEKSAAVHPERLAIIAGESQYRYRETQEITRKIARAMWARGMQGEQPAAIYSQNDARVLFCMLGIMRAGAVWVPINYRNAVDATVEYLNYVEAAWLFYHSNFKDTVAAMRVRVPTLRHLVCLDRHEEDNPSLEEFMAAGSEADEFDWSDAHGNPEGLVGLVPTGGTTGPAKGVMVTNLAWGTMTEMASRYWNCENPVRICLNTAPLSHAAGVVAFTMLSMGATNVVMPRFDPLDVLRNIELHRATHLFLPPAAFYALLEHPQVKNFDYSSLRVFLLAGSPVSPDKLKRGVEIFGPCLCQCYGQTEAPMLLTWLDQQTVAAAAAGDHPERLRSCGQATSAVRLAIMNDEGRLLPAKECGEIVARGTLVTPGYYGLPQATAEVRTHGWHHTGDIGFMDENGYVYIVDRKKDMIITGGFNVYCAEVEAGIMALPEVQECAVVGIPHDKWGEAVKAVVVLREGASLSDDEVIRHCKVRLGGVKAPKSVEFRTEIPKTAAGKTDKKELRRPFWSGKDRAVH
jgi:acyl-CoA synthetase (AMP-forming)/AMP-acid ligase II